MSKKERNHGQAPHSQAETPAEEHEAGVAGTPDGQQAGDTAVFEERDVEGSAERDDQRNDGDTLLSGRSLEPAEYDALSDEEILGQYQIVFEQADDNWSAYVSDLPGCIATGATEAECQIEIIAAIRFHLAGIKEDEEAQAQRQAAVDASQAAIGAQGDHSEPLRADLPAEAEGENASGAGDAGGDLHRGDGGTASELTDEVGFAEPLTPIADVLLKFLEPSQFAFEALQDLKEDNPEWFEELFAFYKANPSAPDEAGRIHIERKFKMKLDERYYTPVFNLLLTACRQFIVGVLAYDDSVLRSIAARELRQHQDRAPMTGEAAFKPDDAPYTPTGFAVE
ncbi:MAG: type II toxin-antitoxin system HicB family antitoxin [Rhizobiaceae bacterium]